MFFSKIFGTGSTFDRRKQLNKRTWVNLHSKNNNLVVLTNCRKHPIGLCSVRFVVVVWLQNYFGRDISFLKSVISAVFDMARRYIQHSIYSMCSYQLHDAKCSSPSAWILTLFNGFHFTMRIMHWLIATKTKEKNTEKLLWCDSRM